jgi:bla regulator protein BlaR1
MTGQANFLQSLGWAVLNSLWQLALLWVVYQLITGIYRGMRASSKSALASGLLIGGFAWFLYTLFSTFYAPTETAILSATFMDAEGNQQLNEWLQQSLPFASALYLALLVVPVLHFIRNYRYVQVIRHYGLTRINVDWRLFVNRVAARMNIRKKVQIWISEYVTSPVTVGFLKPVILVPLAAVNHLTPQQLEAVLLHELSHIKRLDYFVNLVINLVQAVLYFNPFVKALVRIVEREREKSCDEMVLQFQYDSHDYATALLTLEKVNHQQRALAIGAGGKKNDLLHRVELIMGVHKKPVISANKLGGLLAGLLCIIGLNALLLFSQPGKGTRAMEFTHLTSHFDVEKTDALAARTGVTAAAMEQNATVVNHLNQQVANTAAVAMAEYIGAASDPEYITASQEYVPELKKYQEEQVERTLQASKKLLETVQWKAVEKTIADAFDQREKEALKKTYRKEIAKVDWTNWENKLKQAYDKIDWENVNAQLNNAVTQVRLDSMQVVYSKALSKLDGMTKELKTNEMTGIPDTDISLKELELKKAEMQKALSDLKKVRTKKIVHL